MTWFVKDNICFVLWDKLRWSENMARKCTSMLLSPHKMIYKQSFGPWVNQTAKLFRRQFIRLPALLTRLHTRHRRGRCYDTLGGLFVRNAGICIRLWVKDAALIGCVPWTDTPTRVHHRQTNASIPSDSDPHPRTLELHTHTRAQTPAQF